MGKSEIYIHWSINSIRMGEYFLAAWELNKAKTNAEAITAESPYYTLSLKKTKALLAALVVLYQNNISGLHILLAIKAVLKMVLKSYLNIMQLNTTIYY